MEPPARSKLLEAALRLMAANGLTLEGTDRLVGVSAFLADVDAVLATQLARPDRLEPPRYPDHVPPAPAPHEQAPLLGTWGHAHNRKGRTR